MKMNLYLLKRYSLMIMPLLLFIQLINALPYSEFDCSIDVEESVNVLPNFGFDGPIISDNLPDPVKNSAFIENLKISNDYPELIYISKDNRVIVVETDDLKILFTIEIIGNIKKVLVADLENDGIPELIILSDLRIALYSNCGIQKWERDLNSTGMDMDLLKDVSEEVYHIIIAERNLVQAFSSIGTPLWSKEINENNRIITVDIDLKFSEEIILVHNNSISALCHNGSLLWESEFQDSISDVCEFSPPNSILVSLKNGNFYFVDEIGRNNKVINATMNTILLVPWRPSIDAYISGFFAVSPYGHLRAYRLTGDTTGDLTECKKIINVIPCDLDNQKAKPCEIDSYRKNMEENVIISEEGEVSVLIHCHKKNEEQKYENYWEFLPLGINDKGDKIKIIKTGIKNILVSQILRINDESFLFLMTQDGTLYKYKIFSNANSFINNYNRIKSEFETWEDYTEAYRLLKNLDSQFRVYYVLDGEIQEYEDYCELIMEEEKDSARVFLKEGLNKKRDELKEALKDLSEAYFKSIKADLTDEDILNEINGKTYTILDLKEEIIFLCLNFIKRADEAFKEERYEDALSDFVFIRSYWIDFSGYLWLYSDSKEYIEEYSDVGEYYDRWEIENQIRECIKRITAKAEELRKKGKFKEAKEKYSFIIDNLKGADWDYESDINELKSKQSEIENIITQQKEKRKLIIGILIVIISSICTFYLFLKRKIKKEKKIMIIFVCAFFITITIIMKDLNVLKDLIIKIMEGILIANILSILQIDIELDEKNNLASP